jgi:phospholipid transport system transporter-binding protein
MNHWHRRGDGGAPDDELSCAVCATENPHFAAGDRWLLAGPLTVDTAASVLESSREAALPKTGIVDLTGVEGLDSAAVAVLLAWRRRAASEGVELSFTAVPASLSALAELYGVQDLISRVRQSAG